MAKNKKIAIVLGILVCVLLVVGVIFYALNFKKEQDTVVTTGDTMEVPNLDSKNMTYIIEGETFVLKDGVAEKEGEPGKKSVIGIKKKWKI
jgi:flagellar basal body-associated protein FliL